jgi:hypothetical protein
VFVICVIKPLLAIIIRIVTSGGRLLLDLYFSCSFSKTSS